MPLVTSKTGELANYRDYLKRHRRTVKRLCAGLSPEQLTTRAIPPSAITLAGLVRHLARVEHYWFHMVLESNLDVDRLDADDPTGGFHRVDPTEESVAEAFARWTTWTLYADGVLDRLTDADLASQRRDAHGHDSTVRAILVHLIEEYSRHCGHGDLLREVIDGRTGL